MSTAFDDPRPAAELESGAIEPARTGGYAGRVASGGAVLIGGQAVIRIVSLVSIAVMGRVLAPADYGIFSLALVVTGLIQVISDLQVGSAIVRQRTVLDSHFHTAFTIALLRGLFVGALIFAAAGPAAYFVGEPALVEVFRWLALGPLIGGLGNARFVILQREMDFVSEVKNSVVSTVIGTVITIALALALRNYWALVWGSLASVVIRVAMPYLFVRYRPALSLQHWREFVGFGGWLTGANILQYINSRSDTYLVGAQLGTTTLGYYSMGDRMANMATYELTQPFARAIYPGLAAVAHDPARLRDAYYKAQQVVLALVLPVGVGAALCAEPIVILVAGMKWLPAAMVIMFLGPVMALGVMTGPVSALSMTVGDTRSLFMRSLVNFLFRVPMIVAGLFLGGFIGLLIARIFTGMISTLSTLALARRSTGDHFFEPFLRSRRSLAASTAMAAVLLVLQPLMAANPAETMAVIGSLAASVAIGATVYLSTHLLLWRLAGYPDGAERTILAQARSALDRAFRAARPT